MSINAWPTPGDIAEVHPLQSMLSGAPVFDTPESVDSDLRSAFNARTGSLCVVISRREGTHPFTDKLFLVTVDDKVGFIRAHHVRMPRW